MDIHLRHIASEDKTYHHNLYDVTATSPPGDWTSKSASTPSLARARWTTSSTRYVSWDIEVPVTLTVFLKH